MFTGLVTAIGTVRQHRPAGDGLVLEISVPWKDLQPGESIAVDGACLTVASLSKGAFSVEVVGTTLTRTRFAEDSLGRKVNLERALRIGDRLGGHLVQGHVDGIGRVEAVRATESGRLLDIRVPGALAEICIPLGSITVDGVSLTINGLPAPEVVEVSLVPHTVEHTTLRERQAGDAVHLEGDLIGKYVQAMVRERNGIK
ncbi:MAG: riboflavin synthase [Gemmatimonadales bacterium]